MTGLHAASRPFRAAASALVALALLCALVPTVSLLAAHRPPLSLSAAVIAAAAFYALLLALAAALLMRRLTNLATERRVHALEEACRALESQSRERETLLRETHHRVKNDLQILSSTLRLSDTPELAAVDHEILTDSRNRIRAISLIHELLSGSASLAGVSVRRYVSELVSRIECTLKQERDAVSIVSHVGDYYFDADTSVACGLLVNELVTNSLKHAFHGVDSGVILVQVMRLEPGRYLLVVQDNGIGLPKECLLDSRESLGIRLVRALTEQLRGKLDVQSDDGTTWRIQFEAVELAAADSPGGERGPVGELAPQANGKD